MIFKDQGFLDRCLPATMEALRDLRMKRWLIWVDGAGHSFGNWIQIQNSLKRQRSTSRWNHSFVFMAKLCWTRVFQTMVGIHKKLMSTESARTMTIVEEDSSHKTWTKHRNSTVNDVSDLFFCVHFLMWNLNLLELDMYGGLGQASGQRSIPKQDWTVDPQCSWVSVR